MATLRQPARTGLDRPLAEIETTLLRMGERVDEALDLASLALREYNRRLAEQIVAGDARLNAQRDQVEQACLRVIATQQPAAGDLRRVIAALQVSGELERMGDHAAGIATIALRLGRAPTLLAPVADLDEMARAVRRMLRNGLSAFVLARLDEAAQAASWDVAVDATHRRVVDALLVEALSGGSATVEATYLLWAAHNLERIGDRVANVCRRAHFARGVPGLTAVTGPTE